MNIKALEKQVKDGKIPVAEPPQNVSDYKITTGSLKFDLMTDGGLGPGIIRFWGAFEGGKTSASLELAANFLEYHKEKGRVVFIKAEMRLSYGMKHRCRLPFLVMKPGNELECLNNWSHKNILVYTQNKYPEICKFILSVLEAAEDVHVLYIVDSLDWAVMPNDYDNFIDPKKNNQPAGVAKHTKEFLRHATPMMTEGAHMGLYINQVSANIKIDKYSGHEQKEIVAVGGNALLHAADWIIQFKPKTSGAEIKEKEGPAHEEDNPILGSYAKLKILKSPNETTGYSFEYPIKKGESVWKEMELLQSLVSLGLSEKNGAWYSFSEKTVLAIKEKLGIDFPVKFQGDKKLFAYLEQNPEVCAFLTDGLRRAIKQNKISKTSIEAAICEMEDDEDLE